MRIIGGRARGIKIEAGDQEAVRPTTDRIKETLFNIIGDLEETVVVDFFSGSGALGLEALSRGADKVYLVEKDARTCRIIKSNLAKVEKSMGESGKAVILNCDYKQALSRIHETPDIILADPPYADNCILADKFLTDKAISEWADEQTLLALEHLSHFTMPQKSPWKQVRRKDFGICAYTFWEIKET
ncbi:MAG: 16S rRNA (guanine(966)-N(2))-methyltransferase RsmD [Lentisphaeraceae bacterium]|nr:16S rRNA (guanine(966)-N(2))-methyltransferase RsmD [Lentisphaeraceae bacterium]